VLKVLQRFAREESETPMDEIEKAFAVAVTSECDVREHTSFVERLRQSHADAVAQIERDRASLGQLSTGINGQVGDSILEAGLLALTTEPNEDNGAKQFVVAAPPGTGKTSHSIALMAAAVRTTDPDDLSKPYGCLFVVDQIKQADDMYLRTHAILPGKVAVWSTDHDVTRAKPTQMYVPSERRFHVDQLVEHPIAIVTQAFLRTTRADKARRVIRGDHTVPRALTIFDEQTRDVEVYDLKQSTLVRVQEDIQRYLRRPDIKTKLDPLYDFVHLQMKRTGNTIETPDHDPEVWRIARELSWFTSDEAEQFALSNGREIEDLDQVFGFAAQMYNNYAFVFRRAGGDHGTHFVAYQPATVPTGNSVLLDATADIDKVTELCSWRTHVAVPEVRFDNLQIVHIHPHLSGNLNELFNKEPNRRNYKEHVEHVIRDLMPVGARGLVICKKALVDHGEIPKTTPQTDNDGKVINPFTWNFDGRHLAVTWWGGYGIGVNDWKQAAYVFQFGEHILPNRTVFAMVQGLRGDKATSGMLSSNKSTNRTPKGVQLAIEGHLLRQMKQMGMRGRARSFDPHGICGEQVLVLTCEFERLLIHADQLFPGATLSKWGRTQMQFESLSTISDAAGDTHGPQCARAHRGDEIAQRMGVQRWGSVSTNAMTEKVNRALPNLGWTYERKRGPGGGSWFIKSGNAVLRPQEWKVQIENVPIAAG
jgi:hypothetical protein